MKKMALIMTLTLVLAPTIAGCTRTGEPEPTTRRQEKPAAAQPTDRIDVPATVRSNLGITFAKVERREIQDTIRVPGAFELQPLARREYRMTLPGEVELLVDQYQPVEAGQVLYRFKSPAWPELQHEIIIGEQAIQTSGAAIEVARAQLEEAEQRLVIVRVRLAALAEAEFRQAGLESEAAQVKASLPRLRAEVEKARTALANAEGMREHALHRASTATGIPESQLSEEVQEDGRTIPAYRTIDWIDVVAAEPGIVEELMVTNGSYVESPAVVLSIVDPTQVRFRAMALQADLARLVEETRARIVPPTANGLDMGDGVPAVVTIGLEADPDQRTVTLLATPEQMRPWIRPGVSAFLEVVVESTGGPALAIPRAAVVKDGIVHVFFRRDPKDANKVIRVEADLGATDGRWIAINSGLGPNDEVVLDGAYELKLASQQGGIAQKGGHFHSDGTFHSEDH